MSWRIDRSNKPPIPIVNHDTTIGSSEHSGVRIEGLEPQHALLRIVAGRLFLESVDEAPLFVNGESLAQTFLKSGDKIQFTTGGEEFVLNKEDAPVSVEAPPNDVAATAPFSILGAPQVQLPQKLQRNSAVPTWAIAASIVPLILIVLYFAPTLKPERKSASKTVAVMTEQIEPKVESAPKKAEEPSKTPVAVAPAAVADAKPAPAALEVVKPPPAVVKSETPPVGASSDPFPVGSVWKNDTLKMSLTVAQRDGENFQGKFLVGQAITREVRGTVKDGEVHWLARQVKAVRGDAGGDHIGKFGDSDRSNALDFEWTSDAAFGRFVLQRE